MRGIVQFAKTGNRDFRRNLLRAPKAVHSICPNILKAEFETPETGEAYVWQNCLDQRSIDGCRNYIGTAIENSGCWYSKFNS